MWPMPGTAPVRPWWSLIPVIAVLVAGCERAWDSANRVALRNDLWRLCARNGVAVELHDCRMVGSTRDGICAARVTEEDVTRLVEGLGLTRVDAAAIGDPRLVAALRTAACNGGDDSTDRPEVYAVFGRPATLRLPDGTAFEHLVMVVRSLGRGVCLYASYAYG